jgi:hypothetical protein
MIIFIVNLQSRESFITKLTHEINFFLFFQYNTKRTNKMQLKQQLAKYQSHQLQER